MVASIICRFVGAETALADGQVFAESIDRLVFGFVADRKVFVGVAGSPEIEGDVYIRTKGIVEETGFAVVRVGSKELGPATGRAIELFDLFFTTQLDFILPED